MIRKPRITRITDTNHTHKRCKNTPCVHHILYKYKHRMYEHSPCTFTRNMYPRARTHDTLLTHSVERAQTLNYTLTRTHDTLLTHSLTHLSVHKYSPYTNSLSFRPLSSRTFTGASPPFSPPSWSSSLLLLSVWLLSSPSPSPSAAGGTSAGPRAVFVRLRAILPRICVCVRVCVRLNVFVHVHVCVYIYIYI